MQSCNAIIARPVPFLAAEGCIVCHVCQLAMARFGGGPSNPPATDDNASNTGSDSEMDEEVLKLYQQRPPSLRVSDSGKKERDPEYHCLMEKVRRRQSTLALKKLRQSLLHPPAKNSLVHSIEAAVTEIKDLQANYVRQRFEYGRLQHQQAVLQNRLNCLRAEMTARGKSAVTSTPLVGGKQNSTVAMPSRPGSLSLLQPTMVIPPISAGVQLANRPGGSLLQHDRGMGPLTFMPPTPPQSQLLISPSFMASPSPVLLPSPILTSPLQLPWSPRTTAQGIRAVTMVPSITGGVFPPLGGISPSLGGILPSLGGISPSLSGISPSLGGISTSLSGISPSMNGISPPILPYAPCLIQLASPTATARVHNHVPLPTHREHPAVTTCADVPHASSSEK